MTEPSLERRDEIFDRACWADSRTDERLLEPDRLLSAMMIFDAVCVHDGVLPALDCHSAEEFEHALAGYRHFGLDDVATVVESIARRSTKSPLSEQERWDFEAALEAEYEAACPDTTVDKAFTAYHARRPGDFANPSANSSS